MHQTQQPDVRERVTILTRKDCDVSHFKGRGAGGQNKQKNSTGVQIIHRESHAIGRNSESRSQEQNQRAAFLSMVQQPKFRVWLAKKRYEMQEGETIEQAVDAMMQDANLKVEIQQQGRWIPLSPTL